MRGFSELLVSESLASPSTIKRKLSTSFRAWFIWLIASTFLLFQIVLQLSTGVMVHGLMHSFQTTALGAGLLSGAYYYIYTLLQTPAGLMIDRFGARRILAIGAVICGMGCFIYALMTSTE